MKFAFSYQNPLDMLCVCENPIKIIDIVVQLKVPGAYLGPKDKDQSRRAINSTRELEFTSGNLI
jgi:hypothetical protein